MKTTIHQPHDKFFKRNLKDKRVAIDFLKSYFNCTETEITHDEFSKRYFDNNRILYINFDEFHIKHFWHHALYSWSPIMEKTFRDGDYE